VAGQELVGQPSSGRKGGFLERNGRNQDGCAYQKVNLPGDQHISPVARTPGTPSIVLCQLADADVVAHVVLTRIEVRL